MTLLVELLTRPIRDAVKLSCSQSSKREKNVERFPHGIRTTTVEALWKSFLSKISVVDLQDDLFFQLMPGLTSMYLKS